ncbi:DUF305 domain-containing protein [Cellulomonas sp. APG4]|uniref:DUF305 domain-containing protein n=1 Tax=Cellulomonas sp. APG4 TaxID=1538656 RepID=UPI00137AB76C|nr:DUF305 domain-containing protein [Cellulomonas sp. APG4]NCT89452.1 DUF305 domain-containing protein [Cellulomonas sp. APG4]
MTHALRRRLATTATAAALVTLLTACAGVADPAAPDPAASQSGEGPAGVAEEDGQDVTPAQADVVFAQMMIVHHEGALEMADLMVERAATEPVRELAGRIAAAQQPEIDLMSGWLEAWGEDHPAGMDHHGMDHTGMDMEGMDQARAMDDLAGLEGVELDRRFLELMVAHHRGAVEMAEAQLVDGQDADARALARTIIDDQTREITEMENLLRDL